MSSELEDRLRDLEALTLLTNRVLYDFVSIQISNGTLDRDSIVALLRFSENQVVQGAPWLEETLRPMADTLRDRLAPAPDETTP